MRSHSDPPLHYFRFPLRNRYRCDAFHDPGLEITHDWSGGPRPQFTRLTQQPSCGSHAVELRIDHHEIRIRHGTINVASSDTSSAAITRTTCLPTRTDRRPASATAHGSGTKGAGPGPVQAARFEALVWTKTDSRWRAAGNPKGVTRPPERRHHNASLRPGTGGAVGGGVPSK